MQAWAAAFYSSGAWKHVRDLAGKRDHYLCQDCLKAGRVTPAEIVHHIVELTPDNINDPDVALSLDNLVSVCRECHAVRHGARRRRYKIDEMGHVTIL